MGDPPPHHILNELLEVSLLGPYHVCGICQIHKVLFFVVPGRLRTHHLVIPWSSEAPRIVDGTVKTLLIL